MHHEAGKGDKQRPTDKDAFDKGFESIFGVKKPTRGSFVYCKEKGELIPREEYYGSSQVNGLAHAPHTDSI
jgi:hypothetical protein